MIDFLKTMGASLFFALAITAALYTTLALALPAPAFIVVLNGVFVTCVIAVFWGYAPLFLDVLRRWRDYDRVAHYVLGVFVLWLSVIVGASNSIFLRSTLEPDMIPVTVITALARFLTIVAAIIQVTAPDFGEGVLYGRERRRLWVGMAVGAVAGIAVIFIQRASL